MNNKTKLKIGEFSRLMRVTVKTLRHYEQLGILLPDSVDDDSGYRYYSVEQMQRLNAIRDLKDIGFSLDEVRDLLLSDERVPSADLLSLKISECERQLDLLNERRRRLGELLDSRKQLETMNNYNIQALPAIIVATHRATIKNYDELGALCCSVIGPEMQRLGCRCTLPGYCFTVEHSQEYTDGKIDIEYCEQVEEALADSPIVKFHTLDAVPMALCVKHYGPYSEFGRTYAEAYRYIDENGYLVAGMPRTSYVDGCWNYDDPSRWLSIIQIPIAKR